jgi:hypothetical protein
VAVGGLAGAALGAAVADNGHYYYSRRYDRVRWNGGNQAEGAIIGGVLGAVVGGAVASNNCY